MWATGRLSCVCFQAAFPCFASSKRPRLLRSRSRCRSCVRHPVVVFDSPCALAPPGGREAVAASRPAEQELREDRRADRRPQLQRCQEPVVADQPPDRHPQGPSVGGCWRGDGITRQDWRNHDIFWTQALLTRERRRATGGEMKVLTAAEGRARDAGVR